MTSCLYYFLLSSCFEFLCFFLGSRSESSDHWFGIFSFQVYAMHSALKFLCKHCLNCIPPILMFYFYLISVQCIFNDVWDIFNLWIFFLVVSCLVSNCLKTLLLSFCYWYLASFHCVQRITVIFLSDVSIATPSFFWVIYRRGIF